jgi:hypothetical protein
MKDKFLTSMCGILIVVLAAALILPNRTISGVMQQCGEFIADMFGF